MTHKVKRVKIVTTDRIEDIFRWGKHLFRPSVTELKEEMKDAEKKGISTIYIHSQVLPE